MKIFSHNLLILNEKKSLQDICALCLQSVDDVGELAIAIPKKVTTMILYVTKKNLIRGSPDYESSNIF